MAGNSVYKVGIVISADAAAVKPGVATAKAEIASIGTTAAETETRMQRLIATATGLHVGAANGNQRAWTGALAAEGLALDNLRAKYNPLFAVIQQYKAAQTEIRTAHAMGALSSDEMTAALQRQRQAALGAIDAIKGISAANAAVAAHSAEMERLRASLIPLYAAQQNYQAALEQISRAERLGAVSTSEATALRLREKESFEALTASMSTTQTKMQQLIAAATGLHVGAGDGNSRAWTGTLAAEGLALDNLRAKYNPLFAVIQQYKAAQTEIRTAHAMGALSSDEMTAALQRQRQAALGAIDAIKGRNAALAGGNAAATGNGAHNFAATNLMYQGQDVITQAIMGANPGVIGLVQGMQMAGGMTGMSLGQAGSSMVAAFTQLLSPVALASVAVTGLTAAAIQYFMTSENEADEASKSLEEHGALIRRLRDAYGEATIGAKEYADESKKILSQDTADSIKNNRTILEQSAKDMLAGITSVPASAFDGKTFLVGLAQSAYSELSQSLADGQPDVQSFVEKLIEIENHPAVPERIKELAKELRATASEGIEAQRALEKLLETQEKIANRASRNYGTAGTAFEADQSRRQLEMQREYEQTLAELNAKSPAEKAAVARQREENRFDPLESADTRNMRIDQAGTLAQVQAEKALADAKRDRVRSIDETVASQQLELSLIGRTISETEALRMQYQLTAQLKAEAAKNGVAVDQDELRLIEEKARAYGRLAEQIAATNAIREQDETIQQLQTELSLVGASDDARRRALATLEAEQRIRQLGINASSAEAQQIRERASAISEMTEQLRRQNEAWNKVRGSAENTIDSMVDGLVDGDISGALESVAKDITSTFLELSVKNPLKNALLGTSYGTLGDVGGLGGIVSKLFGGGDVSAIGGAGAVGSMSVQAGSVMVNGSVVGSAMSALGVDRMFSPANGNAANAAGGSDIQSQIWNFFAGKGLQSHQIAGIMGNINAESAFNPLAVGDGGNALGLFQHNDRASALLAAIGGQGNLGNVGSQLDFAWNELNTSERASLQRLLASTDVRGATSAFAGFERPRGWSLSNPEGADNYVGRLKGAEAALERFGNTTTTATQGLGTLGSGFDQFGRNLTNWFPAAPSGGGGMGGLLGGLFGGGLSSFGQSVFGSSAQFASAWQAGGVGLYSGGGYTGAGGVYEPRGIVHAGEVVWSQADVARHGGVSNVEAMRTGARMSGYASGGAVGVSALPYAANASRFVQREERMPSLQIINQTSTPITGEVQEGQDEGGRRQSRLIISDEMGAAAQQKGGGFQKAMSRQYGLRPRGIPR